MTAALRRGPPDAGRRAFGPAGPGRAGPHALARALAALDALDAPPERVEPVRASGIFPVPVMQVLGGQTPKGRLLGSGIRQQFLMADPEGALRLLYIPPGRKVPEHGHRGLELQGSFSDSEGRFGIGDVKDADGAVEHQPIAGPGETCICLAATDAPLHFQASRLRLLQPLFRIQAMRARTWIIGASTGIGAELARAWSGEGAGLILSALDGAALQALNLPGAQILPLDLADPAALQAACDSLGVGQIDKIWLPRRALPPRPGRRH